MLFTDPFLSFRPLLKVHTLRDASRDDSDSDSDPSMEASRNRDEQRSPGELTLRKTHNSRPRSQRHEARPHSVLVPSVSTLTRDTAASAPSLKRTTLLELYVTSLRRGHAIFSVSFHGRSTIVRVILTPGPCNFHRIKRVKKLQERAAPHVLLHRSKIHQYLLSQIVRVILAQGSCPVLQILDVSSRKQKKVLPKKKNRIPTRGC